MSFSEILKSVKYCHRFKSVSLGSNETTTYLTNHFVISSQKLFPGNWDSGCIQKFSSMSEDEF